MSVDFELPKFLIKAIKEFSHIPDSPVHSTTLGDCVDFIDCIQENIVKTPDTSFRSIIVDTQATQYHPVILLYHVTSNYFILCDATLTGITVFLSNNEILYGSNKKTKIRDHVLNLKQIVCGSIMYILDISFSNNHNLQQTTSPTIKPTSELEIRKRKMLYFHQNSYLMVETKLKFIEENKKWTYENNKPIISVKQKITDLEKDLKDIKEIIKKYNKNPDVNDVVILIGKSLQKCQKWQNFDFRQNALTSNDKQLIDTILI